MLIKVFTQALGWVTIHKKCGPVPSQNSLDAEIGRCAMLVCNLINEWTNVRVDIVFCVVSPPHNAFFGGVLCTRVVPYRASSSRLSVCGWLAARVCEALRCRVVEEEGQAFSLSNDTDSAVASVLKQIGGSLRTFPLRHKLGSSVCKMISLPLTTDDVVKIRTTACLWNVGDKCGLLGDMLKIEKFEKIGTVTRKANACTQC